MAKMKADVQWQGFEKMLSEVVKGAAREVFDARERGLDKAADFLVEKLAAATPTGRTGETAKSWKRTNKYKGVRYISNSRVNNNGIPVVNLLEYGKKGKPFVRKTFEANKEQIKNIIMEEFNK